MSNRNTDKAYIWYVLVKRRDFIAFTEFLSNRLKDDRIVRANGYEKYIIYYLQLTEQEATLLKLSFEVEIYIPSRRANSIKAAKQSTN